VLLVFNLLLNDIKGFIPIASSQVLIMVEICYPFVPIKRQIVSSQLLNQYLKS